MRKKLSIGITTLLEVPETIIFQCLIDIVVCAIFLAYWNSLVYLLLQKNRTQKLQKLQKKYGYPLKVIIQEKITNKKNNNIIKRQRTFTLLTYENLKRDLNLSKYNWKKKSQLKMSMEMSSHKWIQSTGEQEETWLMYVLSGVLTKMFKFIMLNTSEKTKLLVSHKF